MIKFYKSRLLSDTSLVPQFEKEFSKYTGFEYGIAVDSCTSAIKLCLEYEKPAKVAIPTMTYVSVANEILHCGAELELLDECYVNDSYNLQGTCIWDCAHSVKKNDILSGNKYVKACYSFYPTKQVPSYQGGMICTNDIKFATWARLARQMGRTGYGPYYDVEIIGWKCNMTPIQAFEGLESLRRFKRKPHIHLWRIYVLDRDEFIKYMAMNGVECSIHFLPIHQKSAYLQYDNEQFGATDYLIKHTVSLPWYPGIKSRDIKKIERLVASWRKYGNQN